LFFSAAAFANRREFFPDSSPRVPRAKISFRSFVLRRCAGSTNFTLVRERLTAFSRSVGGPKPKKETHNMAKKAAKKKPAKKKKKK